MRRLIGLSVTAALLAVAGYVHERSDEGGSLRWVNQAEYISRAGGGIAGSPLERLERSMKAKPGSRKALGGVRLADGRRIDLYTVETEDAKSCLVEDDPEAGAGGGCLEGGLFQERRVAFSVNTQGGPERFDELYVSGLVAPRIRSADLTLSDGSARPLELSKTGAFVYESTDVELASRILPVGIRLFGPNGTLVEAVSFPPAG